MNTNPPDTEESTEERHKRHRAMLQEHRERKETARQEHYARRHRNSIIAITLV